MVGESELLAIREYFSVHTQPSLILPDGWFGRPFDEALALTEITMSDAALRLSFWNGLQWLEVATPFAVEKNIPNQFLRDESRLETLSVVSVGSISWNWQGGGLGRDFEGGMVTFVAHARQ